MADQALVIPLREVSGAAALSVPSVLVIDRDADCLSQCSTMLEELGYRHHCTSTAPDALNSVGRDPAIQILIVNVHTPGLDGFTMIEEARARVGEARPIAVILLTESPSAELAVKGIHAEAVDLLQKPLDFEAYSAALRRAMRYIDRRRQKIDDGKVTQQLAKIIATLEAAALAPPSVRATGEEISTTLRTIIASRGLRNRFFPNEMFADPAWDILLDLARADADSQQVSVSSACIAASVPMSTALRWVRLMTEAGLLNRWTDPKDRRRDLIALTDKTASSMRDYLAAVHMMLKKV